MRRSKFDVYLDRVSELYGNGLSQEAIACDLGITQSNVSKLLRRWNKRISTSTANHRWISSLTSQELSVLWGTVMGDGNLHITKARGVNARLQMTHSLDQKEWLWWKFEYLRRLFTRDPKEGCRKDGRREVYASSRCHPLLTDLYVRFYNRSKDECTAHVLRKTIDLVKLKVFEKDDLALTTWYGDDGTLRGSHTSLVVGGVSPAEYELVGDWISTVFGLQRIDVEKDNSRKFVTSSSFLEDRIISLLPACMQYKLPRGRIV